MIFGERISVSGGAVELNGFRKKLQREAIFLEEVEKPFNRRGCQDMAKVSFLPFGPLAVVYLSDCEEINKEVKK